MSKLIVEMEMPKRCYECDLADVVCMATGGMFGKEVPSMTWIKTRPSWCPIIGILPEQHGDLIDRYVSIQTFKCIEEAPYSGFDGQEPFYAPEDVVNTLLCQDVVIAAERSET